MNIAGTFSFSLDGVNPLDETTVLPVTGNDHVALNYTYTPYDTDNYVVVQDGGWLQMVKGDLTIISGAVDVDIRYGGGSYGQVELSNNTLAKLSKMEFGLVVNLYLDLTYWMVNPSLKPVGSYANIIATSQPDPNYNTLSKLFTVRVVAKLSQTISTVTVTGTILNRGGGQGTLHATSTSGLPVVFSCANTKVVIAGNTITCTTPGYYQIKANQPGNTDYDPAPTKYYYLTVKYSAVYFTISDNVNITNGRLNFKGGSGSYTWSFYLSPNNVAIQSDKGWSDSTLLNVTSYTLPACYPLGSYFKIVDNNDSTNSAIMYSSQWLPKVNANIGQCSTDPGGGGDVPPTIPGLSGQWSATFYFSQHPGHTRNVIMMLFSDGTGGYVSDDYLDGDNFEIPDEGNLTWDTNGGYLTIRSKDGKINWAAPWIITSKVMVGVNTTLIDISWTSITGVKSDPEDWGDGDMQKSLT
jgi:hypothetical protein